MAIHHATQERAAKHGVILTETKDGHDYSFEAHWPKQNQRLFGNTAKGTLDDMIALIDMRLNFRSFQMVNGTQDDNGQPVFHIKVQDKSGIEVKDRSLAKAFEYAVDLWREYRAEMEEGDEDDAEVEAEEDTDTGSVVASTYRAKYAEMGHPTHCGDWLAQTLNGLVSNKKGSDIELFVAICEANGADMSKYSRTTRGWQGRLRMTGRNILAKRVFESGELRMHNDMGPIKAPAEWLAAQRFTKEKKE